MLRIVIERQLIGQINRGMHCSSSDGLAPHRASGLQTCAATRQLVLSHLTCHNPCNFGIDLGDDFSGLARMRACIKHKHATVQPTTRLEPT